MVRVTGCPFDAAVIDVQKDRGQVETAEDCRQEQSMEEARNICVKKLLFYCDKNTWKYDGSQLDAFQDNPYVVEDITAIRIYKKQPVGMRRKRNTNWIPHCRQENLVEFHGSVYLGWAEWLYSDKEAHSFVIVFYEFRALFQEPEESADK